MTDLLSCCVHVFVRVPPFPGGFSDRDRHLAVQHPRETTAKVYLDAHGT